MWLSRSRPGLVKLTLCCFARHVKRWTCVTFRDFFLLCCKRALSCMCVGNAHFLGIEQSILKIHTPQINTMSLSTGATAPHCPHVCAYTCVFASMNVYVYVTLYTLYLRLSTQCVWHDNVCFAHLCVLCAYSRRMCLWLICGTIQNWPLIRASSAPHPPTDCQCLKWRGSDITAPDTQWPLCARTASQMPAYPSGCQATGRPMWGIMLPGSNVSPYDIRKWNPVCACVWMRCRSYISA